MVSEREVQNAAHILWVMSRHTVCVGCGRYKPTNRERLCRKCMATLIRRHYEATDSTHTESENP